MPAFPSGNFTVFLHAKSGESQYNHKHTGPVMKIFISIGFSLALILAFVFLILELLKSSLY